MEGEEVEMAIHYESYLIGVQGYKGRTEKHSSLDAAKRHILRNIKPGTSRPAWIFRVDNSGKGQRNQLPGQYEVHKDSSGVVGLYIRRPRPNRLSSKPVMTL